jgi:hypothetical protein
MCTHIQGAYFLNAYYMFLFTVRTSDWFPEPLVYKVYVITDYPTSQKQFLSLTFSSLGMAPPGC